MSLDLQKNTEQKTLQCRRAQECTFLVFRFKLERVNYKIFSSGNNQNRQKSISFSMVTIV